MRTSSIGENPRHRIPRFQLKCDFGVVILGVVFAVLGTTARGQIYVASVYDVPSFSKVGEYSLSGTPINPLLISGLRGSIFGLATDGSGYLYTANQLSGIGKYTLFGETVNASLLSYPHATGLAYDGQGPMFVTRDDPAGVAVFNTSGAPVMTPVISSGLFSPQGVAYFDGKLYVLDFLSLYIYTTSGSLVSSVPADTPRSIGFDGKGHMFVPRQSGGAIAEYTTSGTLLNDSLVTG